MIKIYRTDDRSIHEEDKIQEGVWIQMIHPTREEAMQVAEELDIDIDDIMAALDEEESSRIELEPGYTLILVDIPTVEVRHDKRAYTTIPLGIILLQNMIITVCTEDTPILLALMREG